MLFVKPENSSDFSTWKPLSRATDAELAQECARVFREYWHAARPHFERFRHNDAYWRGAHWDLIGEQEPGEPRPHTPVLWSTVDNLHADLVDACPGAAVEARTPADEGKAANVTALFRSVLKRTGFRRVWHDLTAGVLRQGADVLEVFWDKAAHGGLGDVGIQRLSIQSFLFDPAVSDIGESAAVIKFRFERPDAVKARYPAHAESIGCAAEWGADTGCAEGLTLVCDFWWREPLPGDNGVQQFAAHWCRVAGGTVVARSGPGGAYAHGCYPFVVVPYDRVEGSLYSLGIVDRFKQVQWFIDLADQMVLKNLFVSARSKLLVSDGAGIDLDALKNWRNDVIRGRDISPNAVRWFDKAPFADAQLTYSSVKTEQMKQESGQNDFSRGEASGSVTAASAIELLQEAAGKRSRKRVEQLYACCEDAFRLALLLMAEHYTEKRQYSLSFEGKRELREISRSDFLTAGGAALIDFDVDVHAEKAAGTRAARNNGQALELFRLGVIGADAALTLMQFEGKEEIVAGRKIRENEH